MTRSLLAALAAAMALIASPSAAQAQEYMRICAAAGAGYYYIPGTDTCLHWDSGSTVAVTTYGNYEGRTRLRERIDKAIEEIAMVSALPYPRIERGHGFALAGDIGFYEGYTALGLGLAIRVNDNLQMSASGSYGLEEGQQLWRFGLNGSFGQYASGADIVSGRASLTFGPPPSDFEPRWHVTAEGGTVRGGGFDYAQYFTRAEHDYPLLPFEDGDGYTFAASIGRDVNADLAWRLSGRFSSFDQITEGRPLAEPPGSLHYSEYDLRTEISTIDLDALYVLDSDRRFRLIGGVRTFMADEEYAWNSVLWAGGYSRTTGVGVRGGASVDMPIGNSNFRLFGESAISLLYANFDVQAQNRSHRDFWFDDVIFSLDAKAGIGWSVSDSVRLTAAYRVEHWSDLRQVSNYETGKFDGYDVTTHGPVLGAAFSF